MTRVFVHGVEVHSLEEAQQVRDAAVHAAVRPRRPLEPRVFTRDGDEVFVTLVCTRCRRTRPLRAFGLRRMGDGTIRSIPQCKACRGKRDERQAARTQG